MHFLNLDQNTAEWEKFRLEKIGGSDAPIIMGVSPWKTPFQLWLEKRGEAPKAVLKPHMQRGHDLEEKARSSFEKATGIVVFPRIVQSRANECTLKNLGYNFEHNYGHGKKYLSTVFCMLMMLAFLIDQVQEVCCTLFQKCKECIGTYRGLWETMRGFFRAIRVYDWETFYLIITKEKQLVIDTS